MVSLISINLKKLNYFIKDCFINGLDERLKKTAQKICVDSCKKG